MCAAEAPASDFSSAQLDQTWHQARGRVPARASGTVYVSALKARGGATLIVSCDAGMLHGVRVGISQHAVTIEFPERNVCGLLTRQRTKFTGFPKRRSRHFVLQVDDGAQSIAVTVKHLPHAEQWIGNGFEAQSRSALYFSAAIEKGGLTSAGLSFRHCGVEVVRLHLAAESGSRVPPAVIYPFVAALIGQRSLDMGC